MNQNDERVEWEQESGGEKRPSGRKILFAVLRYAGVFVLGAVLVLWLSGISFKELYVKMLVHTHYDGAIDKNAVRENAIAGSIDALGDPNSYYIPQEVGIDLFNETISGNYGGVGIEMKDGKEGITVTRVFEDSPAEKGGVQVGDVLVSADGTSLAEMKFSQVAELVRGEIGSTLVLGINREGNTFDVSLTRAEIASPSIETEILENNIGYMKVTQFDSDTNKEMEKALENMGEISGLVVDLRDNPGGYFMVCLDSLELFLHKDLTLVTAQYKSDEVIYKAEMDGKYQMPMVVLINGNSASSSEIFAACMQDNGRATVLGEKSYGKGSIQRTFAFSENTGLNLTVGHFYSPDGKKIDKEGVTPDRVVVNSGAGDAQLSAAVELLKK